MIKIEKINFGSFVKLGVFTGFSVGILFGVYALILGILGGNAYFNLGSMHITGIKAGIINMFLFPIILAIMGTLFSIVVYWPFNLVNKYILKGIKIRGDFSFIEEE